MGTLSWWISVSLKSTWLCGEHMVGSTIGIGFARVNKSNALRFPPMRGLQGRVRLWPEYHWYNRYGGYGAVSLARGARNVDLLFLSDPPLGPGTASLKISWVRRADIRAPGGCLVLVQGGERRRRGGRCWSSFHNWGNRDSEGNQLAISQVWAARWGRTSLQTSVLETWHSHLSPPRTEAATSLRVFLPS